MALPTPAPAPAPAPTQLEFTHIVAGAVHVVPTVHGDVQRMHLGPAVRRARLGEVTWRAEAEVRTPACFSPREEMRKRVRYSRAPVFPFSLPSGVTTETSSFGARYQILR